MLRLHYEYTASNTINTDTHFSLTYQVTEFNYTSYWYVLVNNNMVSVLLCLTVFGNAGFDV